MSSASIPRTGLFRIGAVGAVAATAVNVVIYGIGRAAGVSYSFSHSTRVGVADVVVLSLVWLAIGLVAVAVAARWRGRRAVRTFQVIGAVLAVVSTWSDLALDGSTAAKLTLALMHLVVGIAYVSSLELYLRAGQTTEAGVARSTVSTHG